MVFDNILRIPGFVCANPNTWSFFINSKVFLQWRSGGGVSVGLVHVVDGHLDSSGGEGLRYVACVSAVHDAAAAAFFCSVAIVAVAGAANGT